MSSEEVTDLDPQETSEWQEAIDVVIEREGPERARYLLNQAINAAFEAGVEPPKNNTPYINTIRRDQQPEYPGDLETSEIFFVLFVGMQPLWLSRPIENQPNLADILPHINLLQSLMRWVITMSGKAQTTRVVAICYSYKVTLHQVLMPERT